jgi:hypothetical protein
MKLWAILTQLQTGIQNNNNETLIDPVAFPSVGIIFKNAEYETCFFLNGTCLKIVTILYRILNLAGSTHRIAKSINENEKKYVKGIIFCNFENV